MSILRTGSPYSPVVKYLPVLVFFVVYFITCIFAAAMLFFGNDFFIAMFEYFSGVAVPTGYSVEQAYVLWALLLVAPICLFLGFSFGMHRLWRSELPPHAALHDFGTTSYTFIFALFLFAASAFLAIGDLFFSGAFRNFDAWSDYGSYIEMRNNLFSLLGYFDFVNLYLVLPFSAAFLLLNLVDSRRGIWIFGLSIAVVTAVLSFFLFQKKAVVVSIFVPGVALLMYYYSTFGWDSILARLFTSFCVLISICYFSLVVWPVYSETTRTADAILRADDLLSVEERRFRDRVGREFTNALGSDRRIHILAYAALAPLTRTAAPSLYYPITFPDVHPYYGLDFGQDILGFGSMPDDNYVIWNQMYPYTSGGTASAPFQFTLYSQVGLSWTFLLSFVVGCIISVFWSIVLDMRVNFFVRYLTCSAVLLFFVYIAIDSLRNSIVASYGIFWVAIFILFIKFFVSRYRMVIF